MQQNRFLYLLSIDKSLKDKQIILLFLQKKIFLIKIIVNKYIQQQQIDTSIIKMRRLEESVADVMIPQDQYNRLVTVERTLAMELQEKTRKYELLERDYLRLYEQKKELERDVKNISSTSINLSSKMVGKQQAYLSNIKAMQNQMLETQQNYIDLIDKLKNEMSDRQKDHLQFINNLQEERQRIKNENQQLRVQIFDLKEKFDEIKRAYQQYQKELYTNLPDISQDIIVIPPIINKRSQPGTDKIQIVHKPQENIFFTQPSKKKQVQNPPPQDLHISNSISSIYTKRIADKIRKLRTQLQAAKDRLAQYEKINQQVRLSNISKQSSVIDASQSILRGKYIKLKVMYAQAQKKLSDSKIEFTKISNLIKVMKLDRT